MCVETVFIGKQCKSCKLISHKTCVHNAPRACRQAEFYVVGADDDEDVAYCLEDPEQVLRQLGVDVTTKTGEADDWSDFQVLQCLYRHHRYPSNMALAISYLQSLPSRLSMRFVERYLPQLCGLLLEAGADAVEDFLCRQSSESLHIALLTIWNLHAAREDAMRDENMERNIYFEKLIKKVMEAACNRTTYMHGKYAALVKKLSQQELHVLQEAVAGHEDPMLMRVRAPSPPPHHPDESRRGPPDNADESAGLQDDESRRKLEASDAQRKPSAGSADDEAVVNGTENGDANGVCIDECHGVDSERLAPKKPALRQQSVAALEQKPLAALGGIASPQQVLQICGADVNERVYTHV